MLTLKQPPAFKFIAGVQLLEQVGFSMLQALLVFYLIFHKHMLDGQAYHIVTTFTSLIFFSTLLGGYLSDRYLGPRVAMLLGLAFQAIGYSFLMSNGASLRFCLSLIVLGSALFKPNLSSFVSLFYYDQDTRRFSGYTFLYLAGELGIVIATILAAYIPEWMGWSTVYSGSTIAACLTFILLISGKRHYERRGTYPGNPTLRTTGLILLALLWFSSVYYLLNHAMLCFLLLGLAGLGVFGSIIMQAVDAHYQRRNRLVLLSVLMFCSVIFWAVCYQEYLTINLFINRSVLRNALGFRIPTIDFLALNALISVVLCPFISSLWNRMYRRRRAPPVILIIALSLLLLSLGMLSLTLGTHFLDSQHHVNMLWVVTAVFFIAVSELILTPLAISLITLLTPKKITGLMLGMWFISMGLGWALAGVLALQATVPSAMLSSITHVEHIYAHAFSDYGLFTLFFALVLVLIRPYLKRHFPVSYH